MYFVWKSDIRSGEGFKTTNNALWITNKICVWDIPGSPAKCLVSDIHLLMEDDLGRLPYWTTIKSEKPELIKSSEITTKFSTYIESGICAKDLSHNCSSSIYLEKIK